MGGADHGLAGDVDLGHAMNTALELADWACEMMRRPRPTEQRHKENPADIVTDTDEAIEQRVREVLRATFPEHSVQGEENGLLEGAAGAPRWVVDPVDGTTNYAHGLGWSSFSLGLAAPDGTPLLAVVAGPYQNEVFTAVRGGGARLNGEPVRTADYGELCGHVVMTEWAAYRPWQGMQHVLDKLSGRWCTVRIMGSSALSLAQVAAGRACAAMIGTYHALDCLPAMLIGTEAGALAFDDHGPVTGSPDGGLLISAPGTAAEAFELWHSARTEQG